MNRIIDQLEAELLRTNIPKMRRYNVSAETVRSITFGKVYQPFHKKVMKDAIYNNSMPRIWSLIQELGALLPMKFTSVQLNHNVCCKPHIDGKNSGLSVIISFGTYTGNDLVVGDQIYNTNRTPTMFDGRQIHSNTPQLSGNKYSLVFFNI